MPIETIMPRDAGITRWLCAVLMVAFVVTGPANASICRAAPDGASGNDGSAWSLPMDLQTAMGDANCTEIWVKEGVYKPVKPVDVANVSAGERAISFNIQSGVKVYGGFAGTEGSIDARNTIDNLTILSGDIDNNDANAASTQIDETSEDAQGSNSYHVVYMDGLVLDGFTITGGKADGAYPLDSGGGVYCYAQGSVKCGPSLSNLTFSGNSASRGGAIHFDCRNSSGCSSPSLSHVTFQGNSATSSGGAMYTFGINSPVLSNASFINNHALSFGGAIANTGSSSLVLGNVTFSGNSATSGGAIFNYGANYGTNSATLKNVTFSGNSASEGGAIYNRTDSHGMVNLNLINVILWGDTAASGPETFNTAYSDGGAITTSVDHSVVQDGCPSGSSCSTLVIADPVLGPLAMHGGSTATMLLGAGSSAIDAGDPLTCISPPVNGVDQRGVFRFENDSILCDIGAVEMKLITDRIFANGFEL